IVLAGSAASDRPGAIGVLSRVGQRRQRPLIGTPRVADSPPTASKTSISSLITCLVQKNQYRRIDRAGGESAMRRGTPAHTANQLPHHAPHGPSPPMSRRAGEAQPAAWRN